MSDEAPPSRDLEVAARALLRPVLKLLFGRGLSRQALDGLCDEAYVEAAAQKLRQDERDVRLQDVAELSGLPLTTVKRFKSIVQAQPRIRAMPIGEQAPIVDAAARVLTGWHSDSAFTDGSGRPLPFRPDSRLFRMLVQSHGNGFTTKELGDFLLSTESVKVNEQGEFEPQRRLVLFARDSDEFAYNAMEAFADLARAMEVDQQNLPVVTGGLQRTCSNDRMPTRIAPLFKSMLRQNAQNFLEVIDDWLVQHEVNHEPSSAAEPVVRLGVGVYIIADK